jgi:hypothetical protein
MDSEEKQTALRAAYLAAVDRLPPGSSFDAFYAALSGWACHPVKVDSSIVGAVLVNGPEIHACIKPEAFGRWLSRRFLRLIDGAVESFGYAMTQAATPAGQRFVERLGFKATRCAPTVFLKVRHGH